MPASAVVVSGMRVDISSRLSFSAASSSSLASTVLRTPVKALSQSRDACAQSCMPSFNASKPLTSPAPASAADAASIDSHRFSFSWKSPVDACSTVRLDFSSVSVICCMDCAVLICAVSASTSEVVHFWTLMSAFCCAFCAAASASAAFFTASSSSL